MATYTELDLSTAILYGGYGVYVNGTIRSNGGWPDFSMPGVPALQADTTYEFQFDFDPSGSASAQAWGATAATQAAYDVSSNATDGLFPYSTADGGVGSTVTVQTGPGVAHFDAAITDGANTPVFETHIDGILTGMRYRVVDGSSGGTFGATQAGWDAAQDFSVEYDEFVSDPRYRATSAGSGAPYFEAWWKFTPNRDMLLELNTFASIAMATTAPDPDTILYVFSGQSFDTRAQVAMSDDTNSKLSQVFMFARSGVEYHVLVGTKAADGSDVNAYVLDAKVVPDVSRWTSVKGTFSEAGTLEAFVANADSSTVFWVLSDEVSNVQLQLVDLVTESPLVGATLERSGYGAGLYWMLPPGVSHPVAIKVSGLAGETFCVHWQRVEDGLGSYVPALPQDKVLDYEPNGTYSPGPSVWQFGAGSPQTHSEGDDWSTLLTEVLAALTMDPAEPSYTGNYATPQYRLWDTGFNRTLSLSAIGFEVAIIPAQYAGDSSQLPTIPSIVSEEDLTSGAGTINSLSVAYAPDDGQSSAEAGGGRVSPIDDTIRSTRFRMGFVNPGWRPPEAGAFGQGEFLDEMLDVGRSSMVMTVATDGTIYGAQELFANKDQVVIDGHAVIAIWPMALEGALEVDPTPPASGSHDMSWFMQFDGFRVRVNITPPMMLNYQWVPGDVVDISEALPDVPAESIDGQAGDLRAVFY